MSHGKDFILAGWRALEISAAVEDNSIEFLVDRLNEIDPFDQTIEINMASAIWIMSQEYINKEIVFRDYNSDDEFFSNSDFKRE